jgi:hypothetical protein
MPFLLSISSANGLYAKNMRRRLNVAMASISRFVRLVATVCQLDMQMRELVCSGRCQAQSGLAARIVGDIGSRLNLAAEDCRASARRRIIRMTNIMYLKSKLATLAAQQHNASVSSNFCKELDSARFYQRAFFCPSILTT